jgi:hypothetical protein
VTKERYSDTYKYFLVEAEVKKAVPMNINSLHHTAHLTIPTAQQYLLKFSPL